MQLWKMKEKKLKLEKRSGKNVCDVICVYPIDYLHAQNTFNSIATNCASCWKRKDQSQVTKNNRRQTKNKHDLKEEIPVGLMHIVRVNRIRHLTEFVAHITFFIEWRITLKSTFAIPFVASPTVCTCIWRKLHFVYFLRVCKERNFLRLKWNERRQHTGID